MSAEAKPVSMAGGADKPRVQRSPVFPFIPLQRAIERARELYDGAKKFPTRVPTAASYWKYGPKSSGGMQTVAALKQFGLLNDSGTGDGRTVQLTELALRLVLGADEAARRTAIQKAALLPPIHAELWSRWQGDLPGDASMREYLLIERHFNPSGAEDLIREYRDTLAFAGLIGSDMESSPDEEPSEPEEPIMEHGARVMTTPAGVVIKPPPATLRRAVSEPERFRVGPNSWAIVQFDGPVDRRAIEKLIKHYESELDFYSATDTPARPDSDDAA